MLFFGGSMQAALLTILVHLEL